MDEIEYYRMCEEAADGEHANACMDAILSDNGSDMTPHALYRSIYKYTECGPWLSVKTWDGRVFHCDKLREVNKDEVRHLLVGSIVEGSDAEVTADWIDLLECETPEDAVKQFNDTVAWVNEQACALWDEANEGESE